MYNYTVEGFLNQRRELAIELRKVKAAWEEFREECKSDPIPPTRVNEIIIKYRSREVAKILKDARKDDYHSFWITKPTLDNLTQLRNHYRNKYEGLESRIKHTSYVGDDGYSYCGKADFDWDTLQDYKNRVLGLTALIVKIKKGLEPKL